MVVVALALKETMERRMVSNRHCDRIIESDTQMFCSSQPVGSLFEIHLILHVGSTRPPTRRGGTDRRHVPKQEARGQEWLLLLHQCRHNPKRIGIAMLHHPKNQFPADKAHGLVNIFFGGFKL